MLKARNLDDQTYEEIVQAAEGRLPWLCPAWTDHNAHDPGITILELMAWYKELQQYHMNQFTDELRCKLLKLAGITRRPAAPARCAVELGPEAPERLEGERLETREEIPFELAEAVPARRPVLAQIRVVQGDRSRDVGELLGDRAITFQPFAQAGGKCSALHIGLSQLGEGDLRLWFEVVPPEGTPRNPFSDPEQAPRTIRWTCLGAEGTRLVRDDTHALSVSGYVVLRPEGEWPAGGDGLHWLTLTLEDPGCEEEVRLSGVSAGRYSALQQETWARSHFFQAPAREDWTVRLADALARDGALAVFVRRADGWAQTDRWRAAADQGGRLLQVDASQAAQDGADNVLAVTLDPMHSGRLLFDAKGLPGETFFLDLEGRTALTESFALLCETLERDGQVRPALWRCVEDLYACGPRDRVFRPALELKGFQKITLQPGESRRVAIPLDGYAFRWFNPRTNQWEVEGGTYRISVGPNAAALEVAGTDPGAVYDKKTLACYFSGRVEDVPDEAFQALLGRPIPEAKWDRSAPLTLEDSFYQLSYARGRAARFANWVLGRMARRKARLGEPDPVSLFIRNMPFRGLVKLSNGLADTKFALAALDMANGHGFRGFFRALSAFVSARLEHRRRRKRLGL